MPGPSSGSSSGSGSESSKDSASELRIRRLVADFERSLRQSLPKENKPQTLDEIERLSDEIGEAVKESIQRDRLEQQGSGFAGSRIACAFCSRVQRARYRGEQTRQIVTLHGSLSLSRAYYYCADCKQGFCPLDGQLGIGSGQLSAAVISLLCRFASYLSFREAARELEIVCGVRLSPRTINRYAAAAGQQLQKTHEARKAHVRRAIEASDPGEQDKLCPVDLRPDRQQITIDGVWTEF